MTRPGETSDGVGGRSRRSDRVGLARGFGRRAGPDPRPVPRRPPGGPRRRPRPAPGRASRAGRGSSRPAWPASSSSTARPAAAAETPAQPGRVPDHPRARPRRHGRRLRGRADLAPPPRGARRSCGSASWPTKRRCSGSGARPRPSPGCTTPTSCRSSPSAASGACTTTPCSSSRAAAWPTSWPNRSAAGKPLPAERRRPLGPPGGRGAGACPPARGDPSRHQAVEPAARRRRGRLADRLRPGQADRRGDADRQRHADGHAAVHEPRAGRVAPAAGRPPHRHLQPGRHALRAGHRPAGVRRGRRRTA